MLVIEMLPDGIYVMALCEDESNRIVEAPSPDCILHVPPPESYIKNTTVNAWDCQSWAVGYLTEQGWSLNPSLCPAHKAAREQRLLKEVQKTKQEVQEQLDTDELLRSLTFDSPGPSPHEEW